jgi:hypothetical protein
MSAFRWTGLCLGCFRTAEVETRYEHAAKALCDSCAAKAPRPRVSAKPARVACDRCRRVGGEHHAVPDAAKPYQLGLLCPRCFGKLGRS